MEGSAENLLLEIEQLTERLRTAREMVARRIIGQSQVIDLAMISLLSGGHALLVGVPGLGKSRLVESLAVVMGLSSNRIQFTPDLMPADIIGSEVLDANADGSRSFRFVEGPVFCQILMADEVNRASPRTQAALLQAMEERRVSISGIDSVLPRPFHVLATQNPIELEGTYPLPEAQLDRFLVKINVGYPDRESERKILFETTGADESKIHEVFDAKEFIAAQRVVRRMPIGEAVVNAILNIVRSCRPDQEESTAIVQQGVGWGPGPRASQSLMLTVRAKALLEGRLAPSLEDVASLAVPVLGHRMSLRFSARSEGVTLDALIDEVIDRHCRGRIPG